LVFLTTWSLWSCRYADDR